MKQTTNENIKQMDITLGGGLISEKIRIDTINHPILIVGLGGTGIDALLRLKYHINRRFRLGDNPVTKKKKQKPDNIEFLAFETNEHDRKRYRGISLDPGNEMVILSNASIGSILNSRSTIPDYITSWLSPDLTITDGTKGASGNRQAGRLLLFEKINHVIDAIDNKIRALRLDQENKLLVFILTGISGGTGGGSFLDIPYIIRGLVERDFGSKGIDKVEISGYLFTPDVHLSGNTLNIHTEEYIQRNGYASLKELDYWMNVEERGERFSQRYGSRLEVNSALPPFNLCHLVSATNVDGVFLKDAYDYCMNVTAENIVNFLAQEDKESEQEFAVADYLSNLISNIATMESNLPMGMNHCANFVYNIMGASAAVLPTEEITTYLGWSLFKEIRTIFEAVPMERDIDDFAASSKIDIDAVGNTLSEMLPSIRLDYEGTDYYSYTNVVKTRRVDLDEKLADLYQLAKRSLSEARRQLPKQLLEALKTNLIDIFLDPGKGPIYASRLIQYENHPCLLLRIDEYQERLKDALTRLTEGIKGLEIECEDRFEEAKKALFINHEKRKNAFIESKINLYRARLRQDCFEELLDIYRDVKKELETQNDRIYLTYVEILNEINKILEKNGGIMAQRSDSPEAKNYYKNYYWNIIEVADCAPEIDESVVAIGAEPLIREFAKMLILESQKWVSDNDLDIVGSLSDFIYDQFSSIMSKSMEEYLKIRYGKEVSLDQVIHDEIAPRLYKDAKPVFHLDNSAGMFTFPSYGMVSVPNNAAEILQGIEAYQRNSLASLKFNIRRSSITNRIFWVNTQNGIPLFAYSPIRVYEELYEKTIDTKEGIGRHLVMTEQENWVDLPSPIPERIWGDTYSNPRQKTRNDHAKQVFESGLNYGSIVEDTSANRYSCVITQDYDFTPYDQDDSIDVLTLSKLLKQLQKLRQGGLPPVKNVTIFGSASQEDAHVNLVRNPKLLNLVEAENKKYEIIEVLIEKLQRAKENKDRAQRFADDFLRTLTGSAIIKKGAHYVYNKDLEEDPWEPFVNLMDHPDYPEFIMYEKFKELPESKKEILLKKARANEDAYLEGELLEMLVKWQTIFSSRKEAIDDDQWNYENGDEMYAFYKNGLIKLNGHLGALRD